MTRARLSEAVLVLVLLLSACAPTPVAMPTPTPTPTPTAMPAPTPSLSPKLKPKPAPISTPLSDDIENDIFVLVNEERAKQGLSTLSKNPDLDALAREYAASKFSDDVEESSDLCDLLRNFWRVTYSSGAPRFNEETASEQVAYCLEQRPLRDALLRPEARETGLGIAIIGDTVYYTQVFDVLAALGGDGEPIRLYENPEAQDLSWDELKEFLRTDDTDQHTYEVGSFVCADFAQILHNRAARAGIRAAYVSVDFREGPSHALNAFSVADSIVFIDPQGDKVAYVEEGRTYGVIGLDVAKDFKYSYFEQYAEWVNQCVQEREAYNAEVTAYNAESQEYNNAVAEYDQEPTPAEYDRLTEWHQRLDEQRAELDRWGKRLEDREAELGIAEGYWDPTEPLVGVVDPMVTRVCIHW